MPFEIRAQHPLPEEVLRIWTEELEFSIQQLSKQRQVEAGIHLARKSLKKTRALLRLVRDPLGDKKYKAANIACRDAARRVSQLRDLAAMQETLDRIETRYRRKNLLIAIGSAREEIALRQQAAREEMKSSDVERSVAVQELNKALNDRRIWKKSEDDFSWIESSMQRVYRRGQKAMKHARQTEDPHLLHLWRKRVKYIWHQLQLIHLIWPQMMDPLAEEFHRLADLLGEEHDLYILLSEIEADTLLAGRMRGKSDLIAAIQSYRDALKLEYFPLGERLYQQKVSNFTRSLSVFWNIWRTELPVLSPIHESS